MKNFGIKTPCTENWEGMQPNEKGAFCQSCAKNVIDFSSMSLMDIKKTLHASSGEEICGRITGKQQESLNIEFKAWQFSSQKKFQSAFLFSLILVFGLSVVSCSDQKDENRLKEVHKVTQTFLQEPEPEEKAVIEEAKITDETFVGYGSSHGCGGLPPDGIGIGCDAPVNDEGHPPPPDLKLYMIGGIGFTTSFETFIIEEIAQEERDSLGNIIPTEFEALAYPNPATGPVTLNLDLPQGDEFAIMLMDMNGKIIQQIHDGKLERGTAEIQFDITDQPAGTYMVAIRSIVYKEVVKVMKL